MHLSVDRYLGCFHVLATLNNAAMNIGVHIGISVFISFIQTPRSGLLDGTVVPFLIFWGTTLMFSTVARPIYSSTNSAPGLSFSTSSPSLVFVVFFITDILTAGVLLWFWFAFPWWWSVMSSILARVCWWSVCLFWTDVYSDHLPIF